MKQVNPMKEMILALKDGLNGGKVCVVSVELEGATHVVGAPPGKPLLFKDKDNARVVMETMAASEKLEEPMAMLLSMHPRYHEGLTLKELSELLTPPYNCTDVIMKGTKTPALSFLQCTGELTETFRETGTPLHIGPDDPTDERCDCSQCELAGTCPDNKLGKKEFDAQQAILSKYIPLSSSYH